ncbi:hypothetical protein EV426DRAFT_354040 [Tirmania nivea]|nr:hypothetical protein EV426DRAFT_354040 [Tirmania nivea]
MHLLICPGLYFVGISCSTTACAQLGVLEASRVLVLMGGDGAPPLGLGDWICVCVRWAPGRVGRDGGACQIAGCLFTGFATLGGAVVWILILVVVGSSVVNSLFLYGALVWAAVPVIVSSGVCDPIVDVAGRGEVWIVSSVYTGDAGRVGISVLLPHRSPHPNTNPDPLLLHHQGCKAAAQGLDNPARLNLRECAAWP